MGAGLAVVVTCMEGGAAGSTGYYKDDASPAVCQACGANAATCSSTAILTCNAGHWKNSAACDQCAATGNGVNAATVTCGSATDQVAASCNTGYLLASGACTKCTFVGAADGATITCTSATDGCATACGCGTTKMTSGSCAASSYTCSATCAAGSYSNNNICTMCYPTGAANALTYTCTSALDTVVASCDTGFTLTDGACVADAAAATTAAPAAPAPAAALVQSWSSIV